MRSPSVQGACRSARGGVLLRVPPSHSCFGSSERSSDPRSAPDRESTLSTVSKRNEVMAGLSARGKSGCGRKWGTAIRFSLVESLCFQCRCGTRIGGCPLFSRPRTCTTGCYGVLRPSGGEKCGLVLLQLQFGDRFAVHFVGPVGEPQRSSGGPGRRQEEIVAHAGSAVRLDGPIENP